MSRSWLRGETGKWRMFCDLCFGHDADTFSSQPDLSIYHGKGWWIGSKVDACPACVASGLTPTDTLHPRFTEAA